MSAKRLKRLTGVPVMPAAARPASQAARDGQRRDEPKPCAKEFHEHESEHGESCGDEPREAEAEGRKEFPEVGAAVEPVNAVDPGRSCSGSSAAFFPAESVTGTRITTPSDVRATSER